jgi:hypothetical protein
MSELLDMMFAYKAFHHDHPKGGWRMREYGQSRPGPLPGGLAGGLAGLDPEWAEYVARVDREMAAGPGDQPGSWMAEDGEPGPWDTGDDEPDDPDDPAGSRASWRPGFGQGGEADVLPPGPLLAGLTEAAVTDLASLSDNELVGVMQATCRQVAREQFKQVLVTAEFARRRQAASEGAARRGVPVHCRPGGFPGEELAAELVVSRDEASHRIDDALDLTSRLPRTLAGMAAGRIDAVRAGWIAMYTRSLAPADAAMADEVLAGDAPDLRAEQLARKAAALEKRLAPEAVRARRERARRCGQRVEARRELSGNASLAGREMDTTDVMASKAYLDAVAARLRHGGLPWPLGALRVLALADLTQGRDPLDRLKPQDRPAPRPDAPPAPAGAGPDAPGGAGGTDPDAWPGWGAGDTDSDDDTEDPRREDPCPGEAAAGGPAPAPVPALVNLIIPVGALLGWSAAPAQAGAWGLLDGDEARAIAAAAACHPATRWCATLTGPDGTALAHACARGQHPRLLGNLQPQPPPAQLTDLLHRLGLTFTPIAAGICDHAQAEDHYAPSRKLRHLVRARTATCDAPGCHAPALNADLDHTVPWPDGPTDQCNLAPRCRTHHHAKQAPDWQAEQLAPGVTRWTLPSGRTHTTTPTKYDT